MTWLYEGKPYTLPDDFTTDDYYGFVYLITNRATAKKYIGKKFFWSKKTLPKTKTRVRKRSILLNQIGNHIMDLIEF